MLYNDTYNVVSCLKSLRLNALMHLSPVRCVHAQAVSTPWSLQQYTTKSTSASVYPRGISSFWIVGVRLPAKAKVFSPLHSVQTGSGVHLASYPNSLLIKQSGLGADHSTRRRFQEWYNYIPLTEFFTWCLINEAQGKYRPLLSVS
jgi:hypothetical protein